MILQNPDKILRQKAQAVPINEISSPKIKKVIADMKKALASQEDGVALAAPQIGVSLRIFVVSGKIFDPNFNSKTPGPQLPAPSCELPDRVFINPKIIKLSKKKENMHEGCLSCRWLYGYVRRSTNMTIEAYDENGKKFTRGAGGLLAQIFQHEIDHLDGVLFIDKAINVQAVLPEKISKS